MKVSIVTISFNQSSFIERAILSVLDQDYHEIEYILIDAGSSDGSREIIEKYRDRITKIIYEKDKGPADGLNKGFSYATGKLFAFLNADDEYLPGAITRIVNIFSKENEVDIISGQGFFIDEKNRRLKKILSSKFTPWLYAHGAVTVFQQGTFFRSNYFKKVTGFNIQNHTCWDGELFLDIVMAGANHKVILDELALFRLHKSSITGTGKLNEKYRKDQLRLFYKIKKRDRNIFLDIPQDFLARLIKYCSSFLSRHTKKFI
jgi:glycosyltransferase involved in cell wall biosynthesis